MKIMKKHAMAIADMFVFMAFEGYYPMNPDEADLIGRVLGFAVRHKLAEKEGLEETKGYGDIKIQIAARLDLTRADLPAIIEIYDEVLGDPQLKEDALLDIPKAIKYLEENLELAE